jgi:hypothetical protein
VIVTMQPCCAGAVKDLAWSEDSKRIVVGGDGRDKFGAAIMWDTGATVGEVCSQGITTPVHSPPKPPKRIVGQGRRSVCSVRG